MPQAGINYNPEEMDKQFNTIAAAMNPEKKSEPEPKAEDSLYWALANALDNAESVKRGQNSREISLVITKIEEAQMWLNKLHPIVK